MVAAKAPLVKEFTKVTLRYHACAQPSEAAPRVRHTSAKWRTALGGAGSRPADDTIVARVRNTT